MEKNKEKANANALSVYFHWPFCLSKCPYCGFMSIPTSFDSEEFELYSDLLLKDLKISLEKLSADFQIKTIFFGGGTPSLISAESISKILDFLQKNYEIENEAEISLEANPATFDLQKIRDFRSVGINRISLGIQSFSDINLQYLGRIYDAKQANTSAEIVAKIFDNFSFDFMYGYETQNTDSLLSDLQTALNFDCKHFSCYQLTIEENTPFYDKATSKKIKTISEKEEIILYNAIEDFLKENAIERYEISNYAKKNFECKHNLAYWKYNNYLGIGPSAHGRLEINGAKYATEKIKSPILWKEALEEPQNQSTYSVFKKLTEYEKFQEILIVGLRLIEGINLIELNPKELNNFKNFISKEKIQFLEKKKLLKIERSKKNNAKIRLTKSGLLKLNSIIEFLV